MGAIAIAGNNASPSLLIALPIWAERGMKPERYIVVISICGPHPGKKPIKIAIKGVNAAIGANTLLKSKVAK